MTVLSKGMDKESKPSGQMVMKLAKMNGIGETFRNLVSSHAALLALPYVINETRSAKDIEDRAKKCLSDEAVEQALQSVYSRYFTGEDILDIIAFLKTRAGKQMGNCDMSIREELVSASTDLAVLVAVAVVTEMGSERL